MTSIAPIAATLTVCFPAPSNAYDAEMVAAYATGTGAAELARRYLSAGGDAERVVAIVLETVATAVAPTAVGRSLLAFAAALQAGEERSTAELEATSDLCDVQLNDCGEAVHEALVAGYFADRACGLGAGNESACELVRQVAMLAPFVRDDGSASLRGRVLANGLRALSAPQQSEER
jgi:hypothetical protein